MENAIITFKDRDSDKKIVITLSYDKESSNLDYDVDLDKSYSPNSKLDFIGFLASMFLKMLQTKEE